MECGIRLLHIAESTYHLGCMGTVGHAQIPCVQAPLEAI